MPELTESFKWGSIGQEAGLHAKNPISSSNSRANLRWDKKNAAFGSSKFKSKEIMKLTKIFGGKCSV